MFWEQYGGRLTPVGAQQHFRLGEDLREKYLIREQLLEEQVRRRFVFARLALRCGRTPVNMLRVPTAGVLCAHNCVASGPDELEYPCSYPSLGVSDVAAGTGSVTASGRVYFESGSHPHERTEVSYHAGCSGGQDAHPSQLAP